MEGDLNNGVFKGMVKHHLKGILSITGTRAGRLLVPVLNTIITEVAIFEFELHTVDEI